MCDRQYSESSPCSGRPGTGAWSAVDLGGLTALPIDERFRRETLDLLAKVAAWMASARRWQEIDEALVEMMAALDAADFAALDAAIGELEDLDPVRATRVGTEPTTPPPPPTRERLNETVHKIGT